MSRLHFFLEALKNFREVGTVTRSGEALSNKMSSFFEKNDKYILEVGAGDGAITRSILRGLPKDGKLLSFEINPNMYDQLCEIKDPRFFPINDSAEHIEKYMKEHNIDQFDGVASAIPYLVLPEDLAVKILSLCKKNLKMGKNYTQVHYAKTKVGLYKRIFGNIETHFVLLNIPPAYAFRCVKREE